MKYFKLLAVLSAMAVLLTGCGTKLNESLDSDDAVTGFNNNLESTEYMLVSENESLGLYFNKDTTAFKIVDKSNGCEWFSTGSTAQTESEISAPFILSYVDETGLIEQMDAMTDSIAEGQYKYERTDNGIKVIYSLGEYETVINVPLALTEERLKEIAENIEDEFVKSQFENMYQYIDADNLDDENRKTFFEKYPKLSEGPLYILRERISDSQDKMKELSKLLASNGYTEKMYDEDKKYFTDTDSKKEEQTPQFRVAVEYTLEGETLKVTVPYEEIQMNSEFPLVEIELLKYFGSPQQGDTGYFLLPDGSGSLMNFYNGRGDLPGYSVDIYGMDYAAADSENVYQCEQAYMPIFGIKNGNNAIFSVIEKGDAIATVNAYPGNEQLKAYAAPTFKIRSYYKSYMGNSNTSSNYFVSIQNQRYQDDIVVRYAFLSGDKAGYSGMAEWYGNYLFGETKTVQSNSAGVVVECVGQIDKTVKALGIGFDKEIPLTTFDQVKNISSELKNMGIERLSVKLSGWFGGSYGNRYAGKLKLNSKLGSRKDFTELSEYLSDNNIGFYPDADLQYTYKTSLFDGFSVSGDSATLVSKSKGYKIDYNPATFLRDPDFKTPAYINNPKAIKNAFEAFFESYKDYSVEAVSLRNIGRNLDGDYDDENGTDRQKAADMILESLSKVADDYGIMTNGANAYTLKYLDYCCDVPLKSNRRDNTDESVPFLQMILSGNRSYSGPAINLSGDPESVLLDMAAVAADAYYIVTAQNSEEVRDSDYSFLFSSDFDYLKDGMKELLEKYLEDMDGIAGKRITDYRKLADNLYKTVFEDGSSVTVNYDVDDITADNVTYKARSYTVDKKEAK